MQLVKLVCILLLLRSEVSTVKTLESTNTLEMKGLLEESEHEEAKIDVNRSLILLISTLMKWVQYRH